VLALVAIAVVPVAVTAVLAAQRGTAGESAKYVAPPTTPTWRV
jgi:hypothetical protein